ncbi:MAG: Crp/Fnr family transcriptional regulator [Hyphomicrobiales bacterium]|nr:MAG: Crp/Fnr family transcriptional regulator [Hyphomicrobiales bacterium]
MPETHLIDTFLRKLELRDTLTVAEREALAACAESESDYPAGADLVREGDRPLESMLVTRGFTTRYRDSADGNRQIGAIHVPGDFVDLQSLILKHMDHSVGALSDCHVVKFPHSRLTALTREHPHLTRLLWLMTLIDSSIHREWLFAAGRGAPEQLSHLICELYVRLAVTDLVVDQRFNLPMTQVELGEALGLSAVHVNRTLQQLRSEDLFTWQGQEVRILDWDGLRRRAQFDPTYLHLVSEPR